MVAPVSGELEKSENGGGFLLCRSRKKGGYKNGCAVYHFEWYLIDIYNNQAQTCTIPPMPFGVCRQSSSAIISSSFIFVIGGQCIDKFFCPLGHEDWHQHSTVHYLDISQPPNQWQWKSGPNLSAGRNIPGIFGFGDDKVYVLGGGLGSPGFPVGEVLDTRFLILNEDKNNNKKKNEKNKNKKKKKKKKKKKGTACPANYLSVKIIAEEEEEEGEEGAEVRYWTPLGVPSDLSQKPDRGFLSDQVVFDAKRGRMIMHFLFLDMVYAYYPHTNSWIPFDRNFGAKNWSRYSVIVDEHDVLYSLGCTLTSDELRNPDLDLSNDFNVAHRLQAYDLVNNKWLKVTWSGPDKHHIYARLFKSFLFHLGHGKLCLVTPCQMREGFAEVWALIFSVHKTSHGEIIAEKEGMKSFSVEGFYDDFISLPQGTLKKFQMEHPC